MSPNSKMLNEHVEFIELWKNVNTDNPKPDEIKEIRKLFGNNPQLYFEKCDMVQSAIENIIDLTKGNLLSKESLRMNVQAIQLNLGYNDALPIERVLIEQVALNWLRMVCTEFSYTYITNSAANLKSLVYWERRLSMTQKRYLKAIETLARIRKITGAGITPRFPAKAIISYFYQIDFNHTLQCCNSFPQPDHNF